jgi:G3E family GTPase
LTRPFSHATQSISILTGALGSGKTTLLNRLVSDPAMKGAMVLINEFGDIGLDHEIVGEISEDVILLASGCMCCSLQGDLRDELVKIIERTRSGELQIDGPIVIETTGLADPLPILKLINSDEVIREAMSVNQIVTVVDAIAAVGQVHEFPEVENQIALADILVPSKTDLSDAAMQSSVSALIERLNPAATVFDNTSDADLQDVIAALTGTYVPRRVAPWFKEQARHRQPGEVGSFVIEIRRTIDKDRFFLWLQLLVQAQGERLLRMKGLIPFADGPAYVHSTGPLFYPPEPLGAGAGKRSFRLIVIARGLEREAIETSFRGFCEGEPPALEAAGDAPLAATTHATVSHDLQAKIAAALPLADLTGQPHELLWGLHNPWSLAGQQLDAWAVLEICESPEILAHVARLLGPDINLLATEVIGPNTRWLRQRKGRALADEAEFFPVGRGQVCACRFSLTDPGGAFRLHPLDGPVDCGPLDGDWLDFVIYYADARAHFDRGDSHPANVARNRVRPLANMAAMPIWLVAGQDRGDNNYAVGFSRPQPEWLRVAAQ